MSVTLTGRWRLAQTKWSGRLVLQVEWASKRMVRVFGTPRWKESTNYFWRDATLKDAQKLGIANVNTV